MRPLIFDYTEVRSEVLPDIPYKYDSKLSMNVLHIKGKSTLFIDTDLSELEIMTKTKVHRENDDTPMLLELGTKTEASRERDDFKDIYLELATKTFSTREREDQNPSNY